MPQTRFVLGKALSIGLRPIVVVNKCDKPDARIEAVVDSVFDLLVDLGADDETLDFPVLYASGRDGWAVEDHEDESRRDAGVRALVDTIREKIPAPADPVDGPLCMQISSLDRNDFVGRIVIGRVVGGELRPGMSIVVHGEDGPVQARTGRVLGFEGLGRREVDRVQAGDLCAIEGLELAGHASSCYRRHRGAPL